MNHRLDSVILEGIAVIRDRLLTMENPLRLESGEPSFATPEHIKEAANRALRDNQTHYSPLNGIAPLRKALLKKLQTKNHIPFLNSPEQIFVTNGGMHALYCTIQTILNEGDEVLYPCPNWPPTGWMIKLAGATLRSVPLREERGFTWDPEEVAAAVTEKTKAIIINTPHNPTGAVFTRQEITRLLEIADKFGLYVISDEAYEDIIYEGTHVSVASVAKEFSKALQDRVISCFTFSKSYAMTGWRIGYLACSGEQFGRELKKTLLYSINGISTPTQYAGIAALEGPQDCVQEMVLEYRKRRDLLYEGINRTPFLTCATPPKGAFYLYARISKGWQGTAWDLTNFLIDSYSIGSIPGDMFLDPKASIRFAYACETNMIEQTIATLMRAQSEVVR